MKTDTQSTEMSSFVVKREGSSPTSSSTALDSKEGYTKQVSTSQQGEEKIDPNQHIYESVWQIIFLVMLSVGVILVEKVYRFHTDPSTVSIPKGSIFDFWVTIVAALVIQSIRYVVKLTCQSTLYDMMSDKRKKTPEEGAKRAEQLCKWLFDFIYYTCSTVIGYLIVKDQPFLPPTMLGTGSCSNLFMQYPYLPEIPYLRLFYLIQAGTHLNSLMIQFIFKRSEPKFYEYALHHLLAMFLVWFSYMMNFLIVGIIVLILHDPGDIFLVAARGYNDLKNSKITVNACLIGLSYPLWIYTRNFVFPQCVIKSCYTFFVGFDFDLYSAEIFYLPLMYMLVMLGVLAVMHVYWTYFYSKGILTFTQGKEKNGYD